MSLLHNSLLWRLSDEDGLHQSFLLGSMHVKDYRAFHLREQINEVLSIVDGVATEVNIDELINTPFTESGLLKDGSLEDLLGAKKYKKWAKTLKKYFGLELEPIKNYIPFFIIQMLLEKLLYESESVSLDNWIWNEAKHRELHLSGIETVKEQMETLTNISWEYQLKSLKDVVQNAPKFKRSILKMVDLYQKQEIQKIFKLTKRSLGGQRKNLLYRRNFIMADRITKQFPERNTLFVVGAAHLAGEKGVLRLLKKNGFKLSPISKDVS